jgi:hypothetical protein
MGHDKFNDDYGRRSGTTIPRQNKTNGNHKEADHFFLQYPFTKSYNIK